MRLAMRLPPELTVVVPVTLIAPLFRVPALTAVLGAESPGNVTTPAPFLMILKLLTIDPFTVILPAPVNVRGPVPVIGPPSVNSPASDPMLALLANVIG